MAKVYRLYVGIITALAFCKYCIAEGNATVESTNPTIDDCHHHGNRDNCTVDPRDTEPWGGHFSRCPEELTHYCIHGECRYIEEQKAPSCRCHKGFIGSRCEHLDLDWRKGEKQQIIIACVIGGLVLLILLIVFICVCSHRRSRLCPWRGRRREERRNGSEKLGMMDTHTVPPDSTAPPETDTV
ncbi:probetacellulin isoform X1 [Pleuronectes platessa]|uniref:probetacellulin isoform X1 n=1 Tax=Pleuronectes platessa TaxID=8262 RepID=UPI00232A132F|nr:probetacellulin isoform X1 [Pleuronectes platessa]